MTRSAPITRKWQGQQDVTVTGFCADVEGCRVRHGRHTHDQGPTTGKAVRIAADDGRDRWVSPQELNTPKW